MDGLAAARARGRASGQKPKLGPRQVKLASQMYDEKDEHGKRRYTVAQIAAEFDVTRPTIYRHLGKAAPAGGGVLAVAEVDDDGVTVDGDGNSGRSWAA